MKLGKLKELLDLAVETYGPTYEVTELIHTMDSFVPEEHQYIVLRSEQRVVVESQRFQPLHDIGEHQHCDGCGSRLD